MAVASFALVACLIGVARFLFVHAMGFDAQAADSAAAATAEEEAASKMRKLQRVTPVIIIQPNQEVPYQTVHNLLLRVKPAEYPKHHDMVGVCMRQQCYQWLLAPASCSNALVPFSDTIQHILCS